MEIEPAGADPPVPVEVEELDWRQLTPLGQDFELTAGGRVLGELGRPPVKRPGAWGECLGREWRIGAVVSFGGTIRVGLLDVATGERGCGFEGPSLARDPAGALP